MPAFAQNLSTARNDNLYLVNGGSDYTDQPAWYFIRVENVKVRAFFRAVEAGNIKLEDFGEIVESGYGEEPPDAIIASMRANYGFVA